MMPEDLEVLRDPEIEASARRCDTHVWALDPPDISSAQHRHHSLIRAAVRRGKLWWNRVTEDYEAVHP